MKILFLDFDGVLNSSEWFDKSRNRHPSKSKYDYMFPHGHIDPEAVSHLSDIVDATGCKIVISSTWRKSNTYEEIESFLLHKKFRHKGSVIGSTCDLGMSASRGYEIHEWLNNSRHDVTSFCILDDDGDMWHLLPWLVGTSHYTGLTEVEKEKAINLLNNPSQSIPESEWIHRWNYFDCDTYRIF